MKHTFAIKAEEYRAGSVEKIVKEDFGRAGFEVEFTELREVAEGNGHARTVEKKYLVNGRSFGEEFGYDLITTKSFNEDGRGRINVEVFSVNSLRARSYQGAIVAAHTNHQDGGKQ